MFRSALAKTVLNTAPRASARSVRPVLARGYHEKVISHYEQPRNVRPVQNNPFIRGYLINSIPLNRSALSQRTLLMSVLVLLAHQRESPFPLCRQFSRF